MLKRLFSLSNGALLVALALSTIAAWYSIIGLTAIFAGAVVPIVIMGTALEFAKITTTVWLRKYWYRCSWVMKVYLVPAVVALALLTSMGIFGFLSKAHLDQNIGSGDVQAQVSLLDEKIATQRENIRSNKAMLAQMDQQVNDIMTKGDSEKSVERSVVIRKQQAKERASLQKDIEVANKEIQRLNEERAPIASELRKVEAEVGPIKYIAALIYGDNADQNMLEAAVRWVIILLVVVFDPLAIMLVLAANQSKEWDEHIDEENKLHEDIEHQRTMEKLVNDDVAAMSIVPPKEEDTRPFTQEEKYALDDGPLTDSQIEQIKKSVEDEFSEVEIKHINNMLFDAKDYDQHFDDGGFEPEPEPTVFEKHPYLNQPFVHFSNMKPMTSSIKEYENVVENYPVEQDYSYIEEDNKRLEEEMVKQPKILAMGIDVIERPGDYIEPYTERHLEDKVPNFEGFKDPSTNEWVQTGPEFDVTSTAEPYKVLGDGYVEYEGKRMTDKVLREYRPDLFNLNPDDQPGVRTGFGITFPEHAHTGDTFVRVDVMPNKVFKFNGVKWIASQSETHLSNVDYLNHLIEKLGTGEYDPEILTDAEQEAVSHHIQNRKI